MKVVFHTGHGMADRQAATPDLLIFFESFTRQAIELK